MRSRAGVGSDFSRRRRRWAGFLTASFGALLSFAGCSGDDGGGDPATGVDAGAARPLVDALCNMARTCCEAAGYPAGPLSDCESEMLRQNDWLTAIANGTVDLHEPEFGQCVDMYEGVATSCVFDETAFAPCRLAATGRALSGDTCEDAIECLRTTEPVACSHALPSEVGTCNTLVRGTSGQACILTGDEGTYGVTYGSDSITLPLAYCDLRDGLFCESGVNGSVCAPVPGEGAACDYDCASGLACIYDVCAPTKANGSPCETSNECEAQHCGTAGLCEPRPVATEKLCSGDYA